MADFNPDLVATLRDELAHHVIGGGYYQTSISLDEADELAQIALETVAPLISAQALTEAAQKYQWGGWAERNPAVHADLASRRRQAEHAVAWLRNRADRIEQGGQP